MPDDRVIRNRNDLQTGEDFLALFLELFVAGIRVDDSARTGLGTTFLEELHPVYSFDAQVPDSSKLSPGFLLMPASPGEPPEFRPDGRPAGGMLLPVHLDARSPFLLGRTGDCCEVVRDGESLMEVLLPPRPAYLNRKTSDGTPVGKVVGPGPAGWLACAPITVCAYFSSGLQCRYCSFMNRSGPKGAVRDPELVAEAFALAWQDGCFDSMVLCGGSLPGRAEQEPYLAVARAVRAATPNLAEADGVLPLDYGGGAPAAGDPGVLEELKEAGFRSCQMNLEIGDRDWFRAVCPGKERAVGYDGWTAALGRAVELFGSDGRVRSHFVAGIEPMETLLETVKRLLDRGVLAFPDAWRPTAGSMLEGHRAPDFPWFRRFYSLLADSYLASPLDLARILGCRSPRFFEVSPCSQFWRVRSGMGTREYWSRLRGEAAGCSSAPGAPI